MEKLIEKIEKYLTVGFIFILPFFVLSISSNPYTVSKLALSVIFIIFAVILIALRSIISGKFSYRSSTYDLPVIIISAAYLASVIFKTPNKMEGVLLPGTATAVIAGTLIYFFINQLKDKAVLLRTLTYSAGVYALFSVAAYFGLFEKIPQLPAFMKAKTFNPEGGYLPSALFLTFMLPLCVSAILTVKDIKLKLLSIFSTILVVAGLSLFVYQILPGKPQAPKFPSTRVSWEVSIDSLKNSPFLGIGPGNYMTAFNRFRPLSFNSSDIWAVRYSTASNFYFTLFTETGLLGLAGMALLVATFYKDAKKQAKESRLVGWGFGALSPVVSFALVILLMAVFPATVFLIIFSFIVLSLVSKTHMSSINLAMHRVGEDSTESASPSKLLAIIIFVPVIGASLYLAFRTFNILRGEYYYKAALESLLANDAQSTFNNMRTAVTINPRVDRYRSTFSRINLILADATARKENLTDADRTMITQLIQAAISEAKASVALNPLRAQNWEVLGRTYQSIIPLANGADVYAAQAYSQAIALDPTNPQTRITLGGLYYGAKNYETAARVLELAVTSKPDLANGHFNLSYAYKESGKLDAAITQMSLVLGLVQPGTKDYETAQKALEELNSKKKSLTSVEATESLTPPAIPTPAIKPKVELPEGSEPPEAPVIEEEAPAEGETPTVTPTP